MTMTNSYQILIAGSADPSRTDYDPLVRDCNATQKAAEEIGVELAKAGCHLLVYSRDFIEMNVVHGFSSVENAPTESIYVRFPGEETPRRISRNIKSILNCSNFKAMYTPNGRRHFIARYEMRMG